MTNLIYSFYFMVALFLTEETQSPKLVWSDEFDYKGIPDPSYWTYHVGDGCPEICGWGNNELQYYTKADERNARVSDGKLVIEAHRTKTGSKEYSSARLRTAKGLSWKYAYVEVRAKLPQGKGTWPAIWMLPEDFKYGGWPASGEIDIMEHVGFDPGVVHGTVHTEAFNHIKGTQVGKQKMVDNFHDEYHIYAINWTEDKIEFFIDNEKYHVFENNKTGFEAWPFDNPFYLILNIAVGGNWGGKEGVDDSIWPQRMEVDYVRVYEPFNSEKQQKAFFSNTKF